MLRWLTTACAYHTVAENGVISFVPPASTGDSGNTITQSSPSFGWGNTPDIESEAFMKPVPTQSPFSGGLASTNSSASIRVSELRVFGGPPAHYYTMSRI